MPLKDPEKRRAYHREYVRKKIKEDPIYRAKHYARTKRNNKKYKERAKKVVRDWKEQGCLLCVEKELCCLVAHHKDPATKLFAIGDALTKNKSAKTIAKELEKCACLCSNCHRKVHAGLLKCE